MNNYADRSFTLFLSSAVVIMTGITPMITNEVGLCAETSVDMSQTAPRAAVHRGLKSKLHRSKSCENTANETNNVFIALPNDRAKSIRPADKTISMQ